MRWSRWFRPLAAVLLASGMIGAVAGLWRYGGRIEPLLALLEQPGPWGPVIVGALYLPAAVLAIPATLLTCAGGFLFGPWATAAAVSVGSTLGACAAFLVGRYVARDWVQRRLEHYARLKALETALSEGGWQTVLLLRLSPLVPYTMLNYACGLSRLRFWDFAWASWVGMMPGTLMYAYLGSAARSVAEAAAGRLPDSPWRTAAFYAGLAASVAVALLLARRARLVVQRTQAALPRHEGTPPSAADADRPAAAAARTTKGEP